MTFTGPRQYHIHETGYKTGTAVTVKIDIFFPLD